MWRSADGRVKTVPGGEKGWEGARCGVGDVVEKFRILRYAPWWTLERWAAARERDTEYVPQCFSRFPTFLFDFEVEEQEESLGELSTLLSVLYFYLGSPALYKAAISSSPAVQVGSIITVSRPIFVM